jgi:GxxExxY protein
MRAVLQNTWNYQRDGDDDDSPGATPMFRPSMFWFPWEESWDSSSIPPIRLAKGSSEQRSTYIVQLSRLPVPRTGAREIACYSQIALPLEYKGIQIAKGYVIDLLIEDSLVVEIKSVVKFLPIQSSQVMTYMRLQRVSSGLLINFNVQLYSTASEESCTAPFRAASVPSVSPW